MISNDSISSRNLFVKSALISVVLGLGVISSLVAKSPSIDPNTSPREILVQSVSNPKFTDDGDCKNDVRKVLDIMERTSSYHPDIICLSEVFANDAESAQEIPGPITNTFSDYARKHHCYIICTLYSMQEGKMYNTAVLIDRNGEIVGMYNKIYPTEGEIKAGATPASDLIPPIFETDFGKIGILICFDINWPNLWESLRERGAEIVFWPSAYPNPKLLSSHARQYGYYVVGNSRINPCYIYDGTGDLISKSGRFENWAFARLNLEKMFCEIDFHVKKVKEIRKKYGRRVKVVYYHDSDWVTIESKSPDLTVKQLAEEYGLVNRWDYIKRAEKYANEHRGN